MSAIHLAAPSPADVDTLLAFELDNRAVFESTINARPPACYSREGVARAVDLAMDEAENDRGYQFLVKSGAGAIPGRVNLGNVRRIEADARAENLGSVRVLQRNGFVQFGHSRRSFELKGVWYDRLHFERHALTSTN